MSKVKALTLDAGGVMVRPLHGDWNVPARYRELLGDYARDVSGEAWREACRAEAHIVREDVYVQDMQAERGLRQEFLRKVAERMGWTLSSDTLAALAEDFTFNTDRYVWYPDVEEYLARWSGQMKLGILSDAMPSFRYVVDHSPNRRYFQAIVISTEIGAAKPDAKMYKTICAQLGVEGADCLFVDDRECNLEGAMRCGMRAVQMCRDDQKPWNGPFVRNLAELNVYLEGLN